MLQTREFTIGRIYCISGIDSQCEWYRTRHHFEGKLMECVEVFDDESAGFQFIDPADCPDEYSAERAFCFTWVKVSEERVSPYFR